MTMVSPTFQTIAFVGLGLIGGSFARLIKKHHPQTTILAYDPHPQVLAQAYMEKVIDVGLSSITDSIVKQADLIIVATHLHQSYEDLKTLKQHWPETLVMDLGSAKQKICRLAEDLELPFVGGHPLAGKEVSGFENSDAELFEDKRFLICPTKFAPLDSIDQLQGWLAQLSLDVHSMSALSHDRLMALVSHFPQAYALVLAKLLKEAEEQWDFHPLEFAGGGLHDHIRLMGSSQTMWENVFHDNQLAVDAVLEDMIGVLQNFREQVQAKATLGGFFEPSHQYYQDYKRQ